MLGVLALAVVLRIVEAGLFWSSTDTDTFAFLTQARMLLSGDVYSWFAVHNKPPLYSMLIAAGGVLGLDLMVSAKMVSLLAGIAVLHPAWLIIRRMGDRWTALLALAVVAFMRDGVDLSGRGISDQVNALVMLYAMYFLLIRGLMEGRVGAMGAAGLLVGLNYLTRTEGLMFLPFGLVLIGVATVARKLAIAAALRGAMVFTAGALLLVGAHVAAVSHDEGRLTFRRNMGQFMLYGAGLRDVPIAGEGVAVNEVQALSEGFPQLALRWPMNFARYLYREMPAYSGYLPMVFLPLGLWADRRQLRLWGLWQLGVLTLLLGLIGLSIIPPHARFLSGLIWFTGWPIARGMIVSAEALIRLNPLRLRRTDWVRITLPTACLAGTLVVAGVDWTYTNFPSDREFVAASDSIREDWHEDGGSGGGEGPLIASFDPHVAWYADARHLNVDKLGFDLPMLADYLRRSEADYLVGPEKEIILLFGDRDPQNPPPFLQFVKVITYQDDRWRSRRLFIYRIVHEVDAGTSDVPVAGAGVGAGWHVAWPPSAGVVLRRRNAQPWAAVLHEEAADEERRGRRRGGRMVIG